MLPASEWLREAQALKEGASRRIDHVCGGGATLKIANLPDKWTAWCFRCGEPGIEDKPRESWQQRLERLARERDRDEALERHVTLPSPVNFDVGSWPLPARAWLYKAGLSLPDIAEIGAYHHEPTSRVVLPIMDEEGNVVYWQARDPSWTRKSERPKYLNPKVDKECLVARFGRGDPLVLTEDVLSAYRVGKHTESWSLLGTDLTTCVASQIDEGREVLVWLDPDSAGRSKGLRILSALHSMGHPASRIESRADPKLLSRREITQWLTRPRQ